MKAYTTISRFEYWPGIAPGIVVPLLLGMTSVEQLLSPVVLEMIVLCILLYFSGFIINSLADREIDKKYETFKTGISESVEFLGEAKVRKILAFQVITAIVLGIHIGLTLRNPWIFVLLGLGVLFGLGYSVKPFYFKVKGIWHAVSLGSSAFFIPLMFIYLTVAKSVEILDIMLILGVTVAHYSMTMANQAADHLEDKQEGVLSPTVRLGLERSLKWSLIMTTAGMIFIMVIVGAMYVSSGYSALFGLSIDGLPAPAIMLLLVIVTIIISIGYYVPLKGLVDLLEYSRKPLPIEERMALIKKRINYSSWQASGIIGITVTLLFLFAGGLYTPFLVDDEAVTENIENGDIDLNLLRISNVVISTDSGGRSTGYADVMVRVATTDIDNKNSITEVKAMVDAGTANTIINTASGFVDTEGRANVRVNLLGYNASEVWYTIYLVYKGQSGSHSWTEPSKSNLYIYDTNIQVSRGLLYDHLELSVKTFNSGPVRDVNSITLKVEWAPLIVSWHSNNITLNPQQTWNARLSQDILKERFDESSIVRIYMYYADKQVDYAEI